MIGVPLFFLSWILACSPARGEVGRLRARLTGGVVLIGSGGLLGDLGAVALGVATPERDAPGRLLLRALVSPERLRGEGFRSRDEWCLRGGIWGRRNGIHWEGSAAAGTCSGLSSTRSKLLLLLPASSKVSFRSFSVLPLRFHIGIFGIFLMMQGGDHNSLHLGDSAVQCVSCANSKRSQIVGNHELATLTI